MSTENGSDGSQLRREVRRIDLIMIALGSIVGVGWLFATGRAANMAGPASLISWVIGGIAALSIALVYAELGSLLPEAGATVRYPHFSHGSLAGFSIGWAQWVSFAATPAAESREVINFLTPHWNWMNSHKTHEALFAIPLILVFVAINAFAVKIFARVTTMATIVKLILPPVTIVAILAVATHWHNLTVHGFAPTGVSGIFKATSAAGVVFAYLGFREPVEMAREAKNPRHDIPFALITAIFSAMALYILLQLAFLVAIPPSAIHHGWSSISYDSPVASAAKLAGLIWLGGLLTAESIFSPAVTGNIYVGTSTRVLYALGKNRYLPPHVARVHPHTAVPFVALAVSSVVATLYLSLGSLIGVITAATVLTYISGPVSAAVIRRRTDRADRAFHLPGFHILGPFAFVAGTLLIYWNGFASNWKALLLVLFGLAFYVVTSNFIWPHYANPPSPRHIKSGLWLVAYYIVMLAMSAIGSGQFGSPLNHHKGLIGFPFDTVLVAAIALAFYRWGVASGLPDWEERPQREERLKGEELSETFVIHRVETEEEEEMEEDLAEIDAELTGTEAE